MSRCKAVLTALVLFCGCAVASAQESGAGAGKMEAGFFPGGGAFYIGGDDNLEVDFNTFNAGGWASWYLNPRIAVEGEGGFGIGLAQDIFYKNREIKHVQMPGTINFSGNVVVFPGGANRRLAGYVTGGAGVLTLLDRHSTNQFGLTSPESFFAANFGAGLKIFRAETGLKGWGGRIDYRILSVGSKDDAVALFAKSKRRTGHRIYMGFLYTIKK